MVPPGRLDPGLAERESAQIDHLDRLVASRAAAGDALEQADPLDPETDVHVGRFGHQLGTDRGAGRDSVGTSQGQVRRERLGLERPAASVEGRVDGRGEVGQRRLTLAQAEPQRARPATWCGNTPAPPIASVERLVPTAPAARTASIGRPDPVVEASDR